MMATPVVPNLTTDITLRRFGYHRYLHPRLVCSRLRDNRSGRSDHRALLLLRDSRSGSISLDHVDCGSLLSHPPTVSPSNTNHPIAPSNSTSAAAHIRICPISRMLYPIAAYFLAIGLSALI